MLEWFRNLKNLRLFEPNAEDILKGMRAFEASKGRPFFRPKDCPFSAYVRRHGVETRQFNTTNHDN